MKHDAPAVRRRRRTQHARADAKRDSAHAQREHDHEHDEPNPFVVFMLFNAVLGALLYAVYYAVQNPMYMMSCTRQQPLVAVHDHFMRAPQFDALREQCLREHPLIVGNELDDDNFRGTRGFVVKFSEDGVQQFRRDKHFACVAPYFDAVRLPDANAFVMNLLVCEAGAGNVAVGTHLDNTIGIRSWRTFVAHQVNVLYAVVPDDMQGGHLHVFPFDHGRPHDHEKPVERVVPRQNRMVAFKGNAWHRVMQFTTKSNGTRVSLVLEQYQVPDSYKSRLVRYGVEKRKGIAMM